MKHVYMQGEGGEGGGGGGGEGGEGKTKVVPDPGGGGDPTPTPDWYKDFKDPGVKEWLKAYGKAYPNAEAVATKAFNLEKFVGAEKSGRGVILPKPDAKPEEWRAFFAKAGMPEKPDGYKLPKDMDKDPGLIKLRDHAHKLGVPAPLFEGLVGFLVEELASKDAGDTADFEARAEKEIRELRQQPGWRTQAEFDRQSLLGQRAAAAFLPHKTKEELTEMLTRIEGAIGTKGTMMLWAAIGNAIGEHGFVAGDIPTADGGMSPAQAREEIALLKKDGEFAKKLQAKDADAVAKWNKLHKIGHGQAVPA